MYLDMLKLARNVKINLNTSPLNTAMEKSIIKELKGCDVNWEDDPSPTTPRAFIEFSAVKNKYQASYWVSDINGKIIVAPGKMYFKKAAGVGKELALRLFGVGGPIEFEGK